MRLQGNAGSTSIPHSPQPVEYEKARKEIASSKMPCSCAQYRHGTRCNTLANGIGERVANHLRSLLHCHVQEPLPGRGCGTDDGQPPTRHVQELHSSKSVVVGDA